MKKLTFSLLLVLSCVNYVHSQSGWVWSAPYPTGSNLEDVYFVNENVGYAVGWNGTIIKTTNGGANWIQLNSGTNLLLYSVFFTNIDTGFVATGDAAFSTNGIILKTTDAGNSWLNTTFNNVGFETITFANNLTGFAAGIYNYSSGILFKTTNAGLNWVQITNIPPSFFSSSQFLNTDSGYISSEQSMIRTTNGGLNWTPVGNGILTGVQNIFFTDFNHGFAVGYYGKIYKTTNAGDNWINLHSDPSYHLFSVKAKDSNTVYAVGGGTLQNQDGKFLKSTNGGNDWDLLNYGNNQNLIGLCRLNDSSYLAVGNWDIIVKTTNNGINFFTQNTRQNIKNIKSISFLNQNLGLAVGDNSLIAKTTDNGLNWVYDSIGNNIHLNSITFSDNSVAYMTGGQTFSTPQFTIYRIKIYKTTNLGTDWTLILGNNDESGYGNKILFLNSRIGFVASKTGILKTSNSGLNWHYVNNSADIFDICFTDSLNGFSCGFNGLIYKTSNGGDSWSQIYSSSNQLFQSIFFTSQLVGYVGGYNNVILKTTNGGYNWLQQSSNVSYMLNVESFFFLDENNGYLLGISFPDYGRAGDIVKTTNGGMNWIHQSSRSNLPTLMWSGLNSFCFINSSNVFIVGENGTILKNSSILSPIGISPINNIIPKTFSLHQNYPNPFNPITKIKFDLPKSSSAKIVIYDLLGREVTTLVNEQLKPGSYETEWDGSNFASGIYFYILITDEFTETKRMVLIK